MNKWQTIADIRREYGSLELTDDIKNPFTLFEMWFSDIILSEKSDPTAMVLSTVDTQGHPDSRIVLLKGIENETFIFYTNYDSTKGLQLAHNPYAALNFYWPSMSRQVRIRGPIQRTSDAQSDDYFASRPRESQISAIASLQSRPLDSRQQLEDTIQQLTKKFQQGSIPRPATWGGYQVIAEEIEFWQGRDNRLHDRLHFNKQGNDWKCQRLFP